MAQRRAAYICFNAVGILFAAVLLITALLAAVELARVNDAAAELEKSIAELERENEILLARCRMQMSLEELESYALNELGMQPRQAEQIVYIEIEEQVG